jgi:hypothetical protein
MRIIKAAHDAIINATDDTLSLIALITDKPVKIDYAPIIGKYIYIGNKRYTQKTLLLPDFLEINYEWMLESTDDVRNEYSGELRAIYIGAKHTGILLNWRKDHGWVNCYSKGNYGNKYACGGTWSSDSDRFYNTIKDAIKDRDYIVKGIYNQDAALREGQALLNALAEIDE